jgi:hypothetical protein
VSCSAAVIDNISQAFSVWLSKLSRGQISVKRGEAFTEQDDVDVYCYDYLSVLTRQLKR